MPENADIQAQLRNLTERQCQILYWVCQGHDYNAVSKLVGWGKDLVQQEMSHIYDTLELSHLKRNERRFVLFQTVCPIHLGQVTDPKTGCSNHVIEIGERATDPRTLALVLRDEREGLIPQRGPVSVRNQENLMLDPYRGGVPEPLPPGPSPLPWILLGIAGTLVVVLIAALVFFLTAGRALLAPGSPAAAPAGVVTVIVTQPALIPTQAPINSGPATPSPVPVPAIASLVPPTPTAGPLNLAGKVANDIPGTKLAIGSIVSSIVDEKTKPYDVYAVDLTAGQDVHFEVSSENSYNMQVYLLNPGTKSLEQASRTAYAINENINTHWKQDFAPAASGTYYFAVFAFNSGQRYILTVRLVSP